VFRSANDKTAFRTSIYNLLKGLSEEDENEEDESEEDENEFINRTLLHKVASYNANKL